MMKPHPTKLLSPGAAFEKNTVGSCHPHDVFCAPKRHGRSKPRVALPGDFQRCTLAIFVLQPLNCAFHLATGRIQKIPLLKQGEMDFSF